MSRFIEWIRAITPKLIWLIIIFGIPFFLINWFLGSIMYVDPLHGCYISINTYQNSDLSSEDNVKIALKAMKKWAPDQYSDTCRYIHTIKDPVTSCSDGMVLGCYTGGSRIEVNASTVSLTSGLVEVIAHETCHAKNRSKGISEADHHGWCYEAGFDARDKMTWGEVYATAKQEKTKPMWFTATNLFKSKFVDACVGLPADDAYPSSIESCYFNMGQKSDSTSECLNVKGNVYDYNCWAGIAFKKHDISVCRVGDLSDNKQTQCIWAVSLRQTDPNACVTDLHLTNSDLDECVIDVAYTQKNVNICESAKWERDYSMNNCFTRVAIATNDTKVCDRLTLGNNTYNDKYR